MSFTLPQSIAVAEAVERGLRRREAEGKDISSMGPVCTIMVGRLDDWLKVLIEKNGISVDPGYTEWAGVAVFKKTYKLFRERGYRIRLLSAAFRNHMHWSELIGADAVVSPPYAWQKRFNASEIEVRPRIDDPVDPKVVDQLLTHFPDFRRAYSEGGLSVDEFDHFPPAAASCRLRCAKSFSCRRPSENLFRRPRADETAIRARARRFALKKGGGRRTAECIRTYEGES